MIVQPTGRRSLITNSPSGGFQIIIPVAKKWPIILFLGFWICGWAVGEVAAAKQILSAKSFGGPNLFIMAWLGAWTVGGIFAIRAWLWFLSGKEIISVSAGFFKIRREIFGMGRTKEFELASMKGLGIRPIVNYTLGARPQSGIDLGGTISFDYGAKTFRFGNGLDEAEAKMIVTELTQRFRIPT